MHSLKYLSIFSWSDVFFSVDCIKTLKCIAKKCGTLGETDDYCRDYKDCRLLPYYLSLILFSNFNPSYLFLFFFFRGDGYCDKKKNVCKVKKKPGQKCFSDSECLNSICLENQKEPVSQKGNNQGFGRFRCVFIQWFEKKKYFFLLLNFLNFFFRQRRLPPPRKFCALIGAKHNQPCDPWSYHCSNGYVCQKKPINRPRFSGTGNPSLGGFLK